MITNDIIITINLNIFSVLFYADVGVSKSWLCVGCLFLSIKFCWNTCMLMHFHIVFGCVLTTLAELSRYKRDCTSPKPKILTVCPSKKKFADPCPKQDCSMKVILTFGPDDSLLWRGILCIVECSGAFLVSSYYHRCL